MVWQPTENLMEGTALIGGYRGGLTMMGDGNGIRVTEIFGGTGNTTIYRATLDGDSLTKVKQWEGKTDAIPAEIGFKEIEWHDIGDIDVLNNWRPNCIPRDDDNNGMGVR